MEELLPYYERELVYLNTVGRELAHQPVACRAPREGGVRTDGDSGGERQRKDTLHPPRLRGRTPERKRVTEASSETRQPMPSACSTRAIHACTLG